MDKEFEEEALRRIEEMEAEGYEFPEAFRKTDWIWAWVLIGAMALLMILGAFV